MPKITSVTFADCNLGFFQGSETDEDTGETRDIWTLQIVDPDGPTVYKLSFSESVRDMLLEQLQGSEVKLASVADLRKLAAKGAEGLPRA